MLHSRMNIIDLLRLIRKHIVLLLVTPVVLAVLVAYLTRKPTYTYSSETTLYTGIASGGGVEMDKSLSFFATNTAFDNLINVIKSRQTQEEVGIRLLAQHLVLDKYDQKYLSKASFIRLKQITPAYIYKLVVRHVDKTTDVEENKPLAVKPSVKPQQSVSQKSYHTIKPGETLYRIAKQYGLSPEELKAMNDLSDNNIEPGQVLKVSSFSDEMESVQSSDDTISAPDTLSSQDTFSFTRLDSASILQWLPSTVSIDAYQHYFGRH